jgi:DNA polymerase III epsilon subunit-like protein
MLPFNQKYLVMDGESEGLNLSYSRPWQFSWLVYEGKNLIDKQDRFPDIPDLQLSEGAARVTGFKQYVYDSKKEPLEDVWRDLKKVLYDPEIKVVGQNLLGYDVYLLRIMALLAGDTPDFSYLTRVLDTRPLGKAVRENIRLPASTADLLSWQYKIMNDRSLKAKVSQKALLDYFSIDYDDTKRHDALVDCQDTFKVFLKIKSALKL